MFEQKLQKGRPGHFAATDLRNKGRAKQARTNECDHCGWIGRSTKPGRWDTNTSFNTSDIHGDGLTQSILIQVIHCHAGLKCLFRLQTGLLPISISFSYIYISQGSVATLLVRGGIFNNYLTANCLQSVPVKKLWKSVNTWWRYALWQWNVFLNTV